MSKESRKAYQKAYCQRPEVKAHHKAYYQRKVEHQKNHPDEYLDVLGKKVYTDGVTKKLKKDLPNIIDYTIKKILRDENNE